MIVLAALGAAAGVAHAQEAVPEPVGKMTPPVGWKVDEDRSRMLEGRFGREEHFGGAAIDVSVQQLVAPAAGALLLVSEIATRTLPADPAAAASLELAGVRDGLDALGESAKVVRWDVAAKADERVTEARLEWSDASLGTTTVGRMLLFQTEAHLVRLHAECILGADAAALRAPCEAALATLAPLAAVAARVPLTVGAPPAPAPATAPTPALEQPGAQIRERTGDVPVAITVKPAKPKTDRRPIYVGIGLALIAAAYLWNRRTKQALAAADEKPPGDRTRDEHKPDTEKKPDEDAP